MNGKSFVDSIFYDTDRIQTLTSDTDFRTLALSWLNRTLKEISAMQDVWWWRFLEKTVETTTIADQMTYDLPPDIDTYKIMSVRDKTNDCSLEYVPIEKFDAMIAQPTDGSGAPTIYTLWANTLKLWPIPSGAYTIDVRYIKTITALTDDDSSTTDVPSKWDNIVLQGALVKAFRFDKDYDAAQIALTEFQTGIQAMQIENEALICHIRKSTSHRGPALRSRAYDQATLN